MFAYLKGIIVSSTPSYTIVEVNGIGYIIYIPARVFVQMPQLGQQVKFYTSFIVREASQTLYGFLAPQDRDFFEVLLNVSGIGPKTALSLIGHLSFGELQGAILQQNIPMLSKVPGIGKKTAERLVVELKDKVLDFAPDPSEHAINIQSDPHSRQIQDAMMALINLGYNQNTAQKAIKLSLNELPEEIDLAALITLALKKV
jgi:holliday junction DNA helicase RuvA